MEDTLFSVKDKVIIVTGGLGQLGAQYVKTLHERGAKVAALATRVDAARVDRVLGAIKDSDRLLCAEVNITDKASINRVLDSIEAKWGVPDGLVNNAGVDTQPSAPPEVSGPFEEFPEEVFREVVEVNLVGTFLMTQQVGKRMKQAGKGGSRSSTSVRSTAWSLRCRISTATKKRTPAFRSSNRWPIRRQSPGCITLPATAPPTGGATAFASIP